MRTFLVPLAIAVLFLVQCGGSTIAPSDSGGVGGLLVTGGNGGGGIGGSVTGGTGGVGGGTGGQTCALGGSPGFCEGNISYPGDSMCVPPSPPGQPVTCEGNTPRCAQGGGCAACPGSGGAPMVSIGTVCVDSTEVTRADYDAWLATAPSTANQPSVCEGNTSFSPDPTCMGQPDVCASNCDSHPQTCVNWCDASAYCKSVGKRLCATFPPQITWPQDPDELGEACHAETPDQFPYGATPLPTACDGADLGIGTTVPVGSLTSCARTYESGTIYDLVGNVWEWQDVCDSSGCTAKGGSYKQLSKSNTCSAESTPHPRDYVASDLGFRCCAP